MSEQSGDRLEAHPAVDRLGGERVAELVRRDVTDAGPLGDSRERAVDADMRNRPPVVGEHEARAESLRPGREPVVEELFQLWV